MWLARCLFVLAVATALALLVSSQSAQVSSGGYLLVHLEREAQRQEWHGRTYRAQISKLKSPKRIARLLEELGIELETAPATQAGQSGTAPAPQTRTASGEEAGADEPSVRSGNVGDTPPGEDSNDVPRMEAVAGLSSQDG